MYDADPDVKQVVDVAKGLEGLRRQDGIHAAAVVITKEPLTDVPADPAQARGRAGPRGRPGRHPVRDARRRGARPAEDGLPRPAQPRRHHRHRRAWSAPRRDPDFDIDAVAARRRSRRSSCSAGATRSACSSWSRRRCGRCCARWRPTSFDDVAAARRALPAGADGVNMHNDYADRKNGRKPVELLPPRRRGGARPTPTA